jgi:DNA-binding response OmpR family regulator
MMDFPKVLVADDDPSLLSLMVRRLSRMGIVPDQASDGPTALKFIAREKYDLIVSDIYMPGATGLEILRAARERDPHVQVVVVTAAATLENAIEALNSGAFGYLTKPFDHMSVFANVIARALQLRRLILDNARMAEAQRRRGDLLELEVTERIQVSRQQQKQMMDLLSALPFGIFLRDEGGNTLFSNPIADYWMEQDAISALHPMKAFLQTVDGDPSDSKTNFIQLNGRELMVTARKLPHAAPKRTVVVLQDIGNMPSSQQARNNIPFRQADRPSAQSSASAPLHPTPSGGFQMKAEADPEEPEGRAVDHSTPEQDAKSPPTEERPRGAIGAHRMLSRWGRWPPPLPSNDKEQK